MEPRNSTSKTRQRQPLWLRALACALLTFTCIGQTWAQMSVSVNYQAPNCPGFNSGLATAVVNGGTPPYNYYWSNGQSGQTISNPANGTLSVTVTDAAYANANGSTTVAIPAAIVLTVTGAADPCLPGGNYLTAIVSGGTSPYNYVWTNGSSAPTASNLTTAGYHFVTVTDSHGCIKVGGASYSPPVQIEAVSHPSKCGATCDGSVEAKILTGTGPFGYAWNAGSQPFSQQQAPAPEGVYTVTVTDGTGCTDVETVFHDDPEPFTITFFSSNPCGSPTNVTANVTGNTPPYTYEWPNGQGGQTGYGIQNGTWVFKVYDSQGCAKEATFSVAASSLQVNTTATQSLCAGQGGGTATVNPTGGSGTYTYMWSNGQTTPTATNLAAGDYTVSVFDGTGCVKTTTVSVAEATPFIVSLTTSPYRCENYGGSATVSISGGSGNFSYVWSDPTLGNNASASNLQPGDYSVTVTDASGCTSVVPIAIADGGMQISMSAQDASCDDNGAATLNVSGNEGQLSYSWSTGATGNSASNLAPGDYSVTVTDVNGCTETMPVPVEDNSFSLDFTVLQTGCPGDATGVIQAVITGGNAGASYIYQWDNFAQSNTIGGLTPGAYTVTVNDNQGCQQVATINLASTPEIAVASNVINSPCDNLSNGNAAVEVNAGASPFTYLWSNGSTAPTAAGLPAGDYVVTITDANGCTKTTDVALQNENMELEVNVMDPTCANTNDGTAIVNVSGGGAAPFTYTWSNGSTAPNLNGIPAGTYNLVVNDAFGCSAQQAFEMEPQVVVEAAFTWGALDCNGNGVNVQFSGEAANGNTWQWSIGGVPVSNLQNPQVLVNQSPAIISLTVTSPEGCVATAEQSIEAAPISLSLAGETDVCSGQTVELSLTVNNPSGGALTYDWSPDQLIVSGDGTPNPVFSGNAAGAVNLSVSVSNGACTVSEDAVLNVVETVTIDPAAISLSQCQDMTVNFSSTSSAAAIWYFNYPDPALTSVEQNPAFTYPQPGAYNVALVPTAQCAEPLYLPVSVTEPPVIAFEVSAADCSEPIEVTFTNISNVPVTTFLWDFGALGTSTEANPVITVTGSQVVNASLVATFNGGCQQTVQDEVSVSSFTPPLLAPSQHACQSGDDVELNPNGDPTFSYLWSGGNLPDPTAVNPIVSASQTATYTVVVTAPNGCSSTQQVTLEVPTEALAISPMDDLVSCNNDPLTLNASTNGGTGVTFVWANDAEFDTPIGTGATLTVQTGAQPINYFVQATDAYGCTAFESLMVQNAAVQAEFDDAFEACKGEEVAIEIDGYEVADFSNWTPFNPFNTPMFENETFTFTLSNDLGCSGEGHLTIKVVEFSDPLDISVEPDEIWVGQTTQIEVTSDPDYTYLWSPEEGLSDPNIANPVATPTTTTTYLVEVTNSANGCRQKKEIEVKVKDIVCDEPYIYLPNAFTPNGDGVNDILKIEGFNVEEAFLSIYDRWGEKVFETSSKEDGWDGSFQGQTVSGDVYGYYLKVRCPGGLEFFKKGNITVLR